MYKNVRYLRRRHGLTQRQMAELLGISTTAYNQKENGARSFKLSEVNKILELFGEPYEQIFLDNSVS